MNRLSFCEVGFCFLLLIANSQNANLLQVEATHHYEGVYFSELLIEQDTFVWQIELFTVNNDTIDSLKKSTNNLMEDSIVKLTILENISNFDAINDPQAIISSFEMHLDNEIINPYHLGSTPITFEVSFNSSSASSLSGFGFPIIWPVDFVYDDSTSFSFEQELYQRLGGSSAYTLEFSDNHINYTYSSGIDFEHFSFDRYSGVLISLHQYVSRVDVEIKMVLKEFPPYIHAVERPITEVDVEKTEAVLNLLPGFSIYSISILGIIFHFKRKLKAYHNPSIRVDSELGRI